MTNAVSATTGITEPTWLVEQLRRHAVLIEADPLRVWLPASASLPSPPPQTPKLAPPCSPWCGCIPAPAELRIQPQRCTRGLPRPAPPGP